MQEDIIDTLLRYGLFLGAIFQLVCIGSVIMMPDSKSEGVNESENGSEDDKSVSDQSSTQVSPLHMQKRKLKDKKKKKL